MAAGVNLEALRAVEEAAREVGITLEDQVNHPDHYGGDTPYEVIKVLEHWLTYEEFVGALKFNIIKYQARAVRKGGKQDLEKSNWYSNYLVDYVARRGPLENDNAD